MHTALQECDASRLKSRRCHSEQCEESLIPHFFRNDKGNGFLLIIFNTLSQFLWKNQEKLLPKIQFLLKLRIQDDDLLCFKLVKAISGKFVFSQTYSFQPHSKNMTGQTFKNFLGFKLFLPGYARSEYIITLKLGLMSLLLVINRTNRPVTTDKSGHLLAESS